jgi:hypothetical protein
MGVKIHLPYRTVGLGTVPSTVCTQGNFARIFSYSTYHVDSCFLTVYSHRFICVMGERKGKSNELEVHKAPKLSEDWEDEATPHTSSYPGSNRCFK